MLARKKHLLWLLLGIVVFFALLALFAAPLWNLFSNPESVKAYIERFGAWGPVIFILIAALQVLISPIPGQALGFAGGFIFGTTLGILYSTLGLMLGSWLAFTLSRKLGRPFVERFVTAKTLEKFDTFVAEKGTIGLFLVYLLPALPDDALCYIAGLTAMRLRTFMVLSTLGRLPGFIVLSAVGNGIASSNTLLSVILISAVAIISILIYIFRKPLEHYMHQLAHKFS